MKSKVQLDVHEYRSMLARLNDIITRLERDASLFQHLETMLEEDVMAWLNVSKKTLYNYRQRGILPCSRVGGRIVYIKLLLILSICNNTISEA